MFNKVALAVATALVSTSAFALAPTETPDIEIFMSGASAQDNGIARLFADICEANTLDTYKDGATATGASHQAYFCRVDVNQVNDGSNDGALAAWVAAHPDTDLVTPGYQGTNPKVLFHKRSAGGSGQGVNPVISETAIAHMVVAASNCTLTATPNLYGCLITGAGQTVNVVSDAGVSDVNPEMFVGANVPSGDAPVDATLVSARMTVVPGAALLFGIPVSEPLYRALQRVQGKTVGMDDEANMPSLSKAEVASIMAGKVANWNVLKAGPAGQGFRDYAVSLGATAPASNLVQICRRVNGSGTQAQMNAKFLNYPCTVGAVQPASSGSPVLGPVISLGSSSGNVDTCLDGHGDNNRWAIGLQGMEKNFLVNGAYPLSYRFVKIDGVAPTLANAANGKYFDWVENTYQWRRVGGNGTDALELGGDKLDIVYTIASNVGRADIVRDVMNPNFVYSFGQSGYLALDTNGTNAPSYPFSNTNPVTPYTHTNGGGLDNCRSPVLLSTAGM